MITVLEIFNGSNGDDTKALYARLETLGPVGVVALNLFRAQKCSARAKEYRRRAHKSEAYDRKNWSMANLCQALLLHAAALNIRWGWKQDPEQEFHNWVLYVDLPTGQVSFHAAGRGQGPDYPADWDRWPGQSAQRIVSWVSSLLGEKTACVECGCDEGHKILCKTGNAKAKAYQDGLEQKHRTAHQPKLLL